MSLKERFSAIVAQLAVNYRREVAAAEKSNLKTALNRWGIDGLEAAVTAHMFDPEEGRFYPTLAHLAKHAEGTSKERAQKAEDAAILGWACIEEALKRIGPYRPLELEDKQALAALQSVGGWAMLATCSYDQLTWKKKEFLAAYVAIERTEELPTSLPGIADIQKKRLNDKQALNNISAKLSQLKQDLTLKS